MNIRSTIKTEMVRIGAERYRITASNEVHFYGVMPNGHRTGWYLKHHDALNYAHQILSDIDDAKRYRYWQV
jgi:hypothetical protein